MRGVHSSAFDYVVPKRLAGESALDYVRRILKVNGVIVPKDPVAFPTTTRLERLAPSKTFEERMDAIFNPPTEPGEEG